MGKGGRPKRIQSSRVVGSRQRHPKKAALEPASDFNTTHGGIDPEINRRVAAQAAEEAAHKGYHWHGPILYNGRHQIVLDWRTYKLVGSGGCDA